MDSFMDFMPRLLYHGCGVACMDPSARFDALKQGLQAVVTMGAGTGTHRSRMTVLTLLFWLAAFLVMPGIMMGDYIRMDEPCPEDEPCPLHPDAECFFECMYVDADGNGQDCIYNFYLDGVRVGCWA
ncbi:uncharacterized protein LOC143292620 isoform X2 [Babylonia areolata]|uniref:uncharacterized protein LOC143292620 isoform X2 n=1 Tax=Babylonia areolata TaxID=304850 RepID=UPI003FD4ED52